MAYDSGLAALILDDLDDYTGIVEKRMFGGMAYMWRGHMLCGVHKNGAMYRVGKDNEARALALDGVRQMDFTGRKMSGFVDVADAAMADDAIRTALLALAAEYVESLPLK